MPTTLSDLISRVGLQLADYVEGAINSATTTTITCTALIGQAPSLKGAQLVFSSSAQPGRVTAYDDNTGTITFSPAQGGAPSGTFKCYPSVAARRYIVEAINRAIDATSQTIVASKATEIPFTLDTEVDLPADVVTVLAVHYKHLLTDGRTNWEPFTAYEIIGDYGSRKLILRTYPLRAIPGLVSPVLRVSYLTRLINLANDTDPLNVDFGHEAAAKEIVVDLALSHLFQRRAQINPQGDESRLYITLSREHKEKADKAMRTLRPPLIARRVQRPGRASYT
jgi:hypothetical protein